MKAVATFDIGTSYVKGVLVNMEGIPLITENRSIDTIYCGPDRSHIEQDPRQWYEAFCDISKRFIAQYQAEEITAIIMSGQMQDLILVDDACNPVSNAILYSDGRAQREANEIERSIGMDVLTNVTANAFDGSRPFAKLKWIKDHAPEAYSRATHVLISSKDYVISKLTGDFVSDVVSCSTAGLMDIQTKEWKHDWLEKMDLKKVQWPKVLYAHRIAGYVTSTAAHETGYCTGTSVYAGSGDAGSATLASGISRDGEYNINLGTSGWVACTSSSPYLAPGVSNLAAMPEDVYINVVPFFNAGNVHRWITNLLFDEGSQSDRFIRMNALLEESEPGSGGLLFLPYLVGERFPVMDADVAGCFVDVRPNVGKANLARACLEGVAYSIRQGLDAIGKAPLSISLVGGGAQSSIWCQILADMLHMPLTVCNDSEYLPAMALLAAILVDPGHAEGYSEITSKFIMSKNCSVYSPDKDAASIYDRSYARFCSIYPAVKRLSSVADTVIHIAGEPRYTFGNDQIN